MLRTNETIETIPNTIGNYIELNDLDGISDYIHSINSISDRRKRDFYLQIIVKALTEAAIENDKPSLLVTGIEKYNIQNADISFLCIEEYLRNRNKEWLQTAQRLLIAIKTKNLRSEYQSRISEQFVDEGIHKSDQELIEIGISFSEMVDFKKNGKS
jgi:hypothetical protein